MSAATGNRLGIGENIGARESQEHQPCPRYSVRTPLRNGTFTHLAETGYFTRPSECIYQSIGIHFDSIGLLTFRGQAFYTVIGLAS